MTSVGINGGTCGPCFAKHDCDFMKLDAEIARRRKATPPASASEKWEVGDWAEFTNAVGERVVGRVESVDARGVDLITTTRITQKPVVTGVLFSDGLRRWTPRVGDRVEFKSNGAWYPGTLSSESKPGSGLWAVRDESGGFVARKESEIRPAASAQRIESEQSAPSAHCGDRHQFTQRTCVRPSGHSENCQDMGGTMWSKAVAPHEPPATAKGDPDVWGIPRDTAPELGEPEYDPATYGIMWDTRTEFQAAMNCAHEIHPVRDECVRCGSPGKLLAALRGREKLPPGKVREKHVPLDSRIAAARRASLESDGKARREAVSTHPPSFPEGAYHDAPECYSTTSSRGGR